MTTNFTIKMQVEKETVQTQFFEFKNKQKKFEDKVQISFPQEILLLTPSPKTCSVNSPNSPNSNTFPIPLSSSMRPQPPSPTLCSLKPSRTNMTPLLLLLSSN